MGLDTLQNGVGLIKSNTGAIVAGATGLAIGGALGATTMAIASRKKTKKSKKSKKNRGCL